MWRRWISSVLPVACFAAATALPPATDIDLALNEGFGDRQWLLVAALGPATVDGDRPTRDPAELAQPPLERRDRLAPC